MGIFFAIKLEIITVWIEKQTALLFSGKLGRRDRYQVISITFYRQNLAKIWAKTGLKLSFDCQISFHQLRTTSLQNVLLN